MKKSVLIVLSIVMFSILAGNLYAYSYEAEKYGKMLATIEWGSASASNTDTFASLLTVLSKKFTESPQQISDMTVKLSQMMKEKRMNQSLKSIMNGMDSIVYNYDSGQSYAEYLSVYLTLRNDGMSHYDAIDGLKDIYSTLMQY